MDIAASIEKNRTALLRMVNCWLMAAFCVQRTRLTLPPRIGRWVCDLVCKAEAAVGYLMIASGYDVEKCAASDRIFLKMADNHRAGSENCGSDREFSIATIIDRLKALRSALKRLAHKTTPLGNSGVTRRFLLQVQTRLMARSSFHRRVAHSLPP